MKTLKQVKQENPHMLKLINAVVKQAGGIETLDGLRSADDGYCGFIYYSDTHEFAIKNRKAITELLNETADQLGEDVVSMVCNFGVFRNNKADNQDKKDLYIFLGGGKPAQGTITNVLAWFALEEVARLFNDY